MRIVRRGMAAVLAAAAAAAIVAACGGSDSSEPPLSAQQACDKLAGVKLAASELALPSGGVDVVTATLVAGTGTTPEYCKLTGAVRPLTAGAPSIGFQLNLPTAWNGKMLQFGGGGFDGNIPNTVGGYNFAPPAEATPLARGFATFASDSGHQALSPGDASFALNAEAFDNFAGAQVKKTRDAAVALVRQRYGASPKRTYFFGGSEGGREAFLAVQRWPQDYDGVVVFQPAYDFTPLLLNANRLAKAIYSGPGLGWLSPVKLSLVNSRMLAACDALDSADGTTRDGLISNPAACAPAFSIPSLRCAGGADTGDTCLSDAQIATMTAVNSPMALPYSLANGLASYPAYSVSGGPDFSFISTMGSKALPSSPPVGGPAGDAALLGLSDGFIRYFITADPAFQSLTFDPAAPAWTARIKALSAALDATSDDISAFQQRGGKLLLAHGTSDALVSVNSSNAYFDRLRSRFGAALDQFAQYYVIPGFGHASGTFLPGWRSLDAIDQWVEAGIVPSGMTATDTPVPGSRSSLGSRPLCQYGTWAQYVSGDVALAASYRCTGSRR